MMRSLFTTLITGAAVFSGGAAHAGTHWSIGISVPVAGVVVSDGRYAPPPPVYYEPAPVVYVPAPRYVAREVYYAPPPAVVYEAGYRRCGHRHGDDRRWSDRRWDDRRWEHERRERWDDEGPRRWR